MMCKTAKFIRLRSLKFRSQLSKFKSWIPSSLTVLTYKIGGIRLHGLPDSFLPNILWFCDEKAKDSKNYHVTSQNFSEAPNTQSPSGPHLFLFSPLTQFLFPLPGLVLLVTSSTPFPFEEQKCLHTLPCFLGGKNQALLETTVLEDRKERSNRNFPKFLRPSAFGQKKEFPFLRLLGICIVPVLLLP